VEPAEITRGLWLWRAPHPDWRPAPPGSADDWPREVGSVLYESGEVALFIDPQLPPDRKAFWLWSDARCAGRDVLVMTTTAFHARSRDAFVERYGAASADGSGGDCAPLLPGSVECFRLEATSETLVWLAQPKALVVGDCILGTGRGRLRLCPESWLDLAPAAVTFDDLRAELGELLGELPIERVLVSHGEPVLTGGCAALATLLAAAGAVRERRR